MKKISLLVSLLVIVTLIISSCTSETSSITKPTTNEEAISEETKTTYSMNEEISVDDITYTVTEAETFTEMGSSMFDKKTEGKFIKVYLKIMNDGKETQTIFTPRFKIEDHKERIYERLSDDMMYIADHLEFGKQLQPGLATSGAIVFELPKDSEDLKLIITGDWLSDKEVKVTLSNIEDIGKDTTQQEELDAEMAEIMS